MYYYSHATLPPTTKPPTPRPAPVITPGLWMSSYPSLLSPLSSLSNNFLSRIWFSWESISQTTVHDRSVRRDLDYVQSNTSLQIFCRTIEKKSDLEKTFYSLEVFNIGGDCNIFYLSSVILFPEDGSYIDRWYTNYVFTSSQHHPRMWCWPALPELDLISSLKDRRYLNRSGLILFDGTVQSVSHYINNFMSFSIRLIDIYHYL